MSFAVIQLVGFGAKPASAPFPQVAATNTSSAASGGTAIISLPSGIVSGNLLIAVCCGYDDRTHTWPAGWTEMWDTDTGNVATSGAYRVADGSEGATITVTFGLGSTVSSHVTFRITSYQGTPESGTAAGGTSTAPNPPSLNPPGWDVAKTLWIAVGTARTTSTASAAPTNYANLLTVSSGSNTAFAARRELEAASDDPDGFTISSSVEWQAQLIAVRGA